MKGGRLCKDGLLQSAMSTDTEALRSGTFSRHLENDLQAIADEFAKGCENEYKGVLCATCFNCPSRKVGAEASVNHMDQRVDVRARTWCGKVGPDGKRGSPEPYCPDWFNTSFNLWADPRSIPNPAAVWAISPSGNPVRASKTALTQSAPFNPKFQNNKTVGELEHEQREELMNAMANASNIGHYPTREQMLESINAKDDYERAEFFGVAGAPATMPEYEPPTVQTIPAQMFEKPKSQDVPQAADAGSW